MSNLTVFASAGLPSVASLSSALRAVATDVGSTGASGIILKMDKTGHWVFGADQTEVEDGSVWAVNPFSFVHGYIAWGDGEVLGEAMTSVSEPLPDTGPAPAGAKRGWEMQVGMTVVCIKGEDEGLQARYSATSVGGKKAVSALGLAIAEQVDTSPNKPVPTVTLKKEHYQHKSYGRIFTPVFDIVGWQGMNSEAAEDADAELPLEDAKEPARRSRRAA
jgi:hypothetical protein